MTIAVTGASGFVGRVLTPLLTAEGHSLRLLTRSDLPVAEMSSTDIRLVKGDLLDRESLAVLVRGADVVIHLAAVISIADEEIEEVVEVNVNGTRHLLDAARDAGVSRFIHLSSLTAYNQAPYDEPMDEHRGPTTSRRRNYDHSKAVSQALALEYNSKGAPEYNGRGMEVLVLAPAGIVGPFDYKPSRIGMAIINIYKGWLPALPPGGVDFVDVRDVAAAIVAAISKGVPGNVYLLSGQWATMKMVAREIARIKGKKRTPPVMPVWLTLGLLPLVKLWARITGTTPLYTRQALGHLLYSNKMIDSTKAKTDLQFQPRSFGETIKDTITWFRQRGMLSL
jgi:dihydroflavonol-4-reductase